jgi:hypothetical protein
MLSEFLNSRKGYCVLETSWQPEIYRMAAFVSALNPDMNQLNRRGKFSIEFDCKPQRFLKSGTVMQEITSGSTLNNPTAFQAQPLIRIYGNGTLTMHMADGSSAVALEPGKMTTLPFAYKLDNAPKFEKFFLLTSRAAFELDANNIDALLKDKDVHNVSITLRKVGGVN